MMNSERRRRIGLVVTIFLIAFSMIGYGLSEERPINDEPTSTALQQQYNDAKQALAQLPVKGRAPKTGYERSQFGDGWTSIDGCDTRNIILNRDLIDTLIDENCLVTTGKLHDPYSGITILFERGQNTSADVQIDHVVALSDAWQKGAQQMQYDDRVKFANDPLNLLAVSGSTNQQKSDSDAASWLPPNKPFRCQYVSRQVLIKKKYNLWVTQAEKDAITNVLSSCVN